MANLHKFYKDTQLRYTALLEIEKKWLVKTGWMRLLSFVIFLIFIFRGINNDGWLEFFIAFLGLSIFLFLLKKSQKHSWLKKHYQALTNLNRDELKGLDGDYATFEDGSEFADHTHPFLHDLDIFGQDSIFQSMNRSFTEKGKNNLAGFLITPLRSSDDIYKRQDATKELKNKTEWRQSFQALATELINEQVDNEVLGNWFSEKRGLFKNRFYPVLAFLFPTISFFLIFLSIIDLIQVEPVFVFLIFALVVVGSLLKKTQRFQNQMAGALKLLGKHSDLIKHIEKEDFQASLLLEKKDILYVEGEPASLVIQKLSRIMDAFDSRNNIFVGVVLNALLMWDIHCLMRFEKWRLRYGHRILPVLESLATFDAYTSLGSYAFNHPEFSFPEPAAGPKWEMEQMGHPLILKNSRVDNDFSIHNKGSVFIITGPNMAGKSTFLRAVGVNLVLAHIGVPVCAAKFVFKPVLVFTSMRTTDSLQKHESYFFSELKRLKQLLDTIEAEGSVFFLLDEILKGTNSIDKTAGSEAVISKLVGLDETGLIATHDLSLGKLEREFPGKVSNKCFDAEIIDNQLVFDYLLHEGITQNMNAAFLMKKMGIV